MSDILSAAIDQHNPSHVFALFSGGDDSVCAAHLAAQHPRFTACVLIDTGIAIADAHAHAREVCRTQGWPLLVVKTPEDYAAIVRAEGFPGPYAHRFMYVLLKERALDALVRDHKTGRLDRIALVTGVRRQESKRRMVSVTSPIVRKGAKLWIAPMWEWNRAERDAYQDANGLPHNPVKAKLHISGDCLCGAYADKGDLAMLRTFYPVEAQRIMDLQAEVATTHPWTWEEAPPRWYQQFKAGQAFLGDEFMPLCWQCDNAAVSP